jgi:hypothetical protein
VRPRISEFSYGFALTRELIDKKWSGLQLTAAPFLPSLVVEGREGGGFDVNLQSVNVLVFLQFKVSHYMTRRTAKGVSTGQLSVPYYRFDVHAPRSSDQHRLLLQLEQQVNVPPHLVRYVAPAFYTEGEFDTAFFARTVSDQSVFVAPSQITLPDDREHSVGFQSPSGGRFVLSEPREIAGTIDYPTFQAGIERTLSLSRPLRVEASEIEALREVVLAIARDIEPETKPEQLFGHATWVQRDRIHSVESLARVDEKTLRRMRPLDAVGRIAWTQFSCQTIALRRL